MVVSSLVTSRSTAVIHLDTNTPPPAALPFVTKWVDYSAKFGFGYTLSNGTSGVVFRDGAVMFGKNDAKKFVYIITL